MRAHACVCAIGMGGRGSDSLKDKRDSGKEFYNNNAACPVMLYNKKKHEFFLSKKNNKKTLFESLASAFKKRMPYCQITNKVRKLAS